jgi:riboflavin synthase
MTNDQVPITRSYFFTEMFTGLITDVGTIDRVQSTDAGREFRIRTSYRDLSAGESIAVGGACLTVREFGDGWFTVAAVLTTLGRTTMGDWEPGRRVNLERALAAGDRLGGHMVQGHVDAVAEVIAVQRLGDALLIDLAIPAELAPLVVLHGSIAVDGVSLTVNAIPDAHTVQLSLIDFTLKATTLGNLRVGHRVQVEADVIGKYVQRLVVPHLAAATE